MNYHVPATSKLDKVMTQEQFDLIVDAILAGKYSWACVLILRVGGYNPLHYIPYRTYNRLMKQHRKERQENENRKPDECSENRQPSSQSRIKDIPYLEAVDVHQKNVRGGYGDYFNCNCSLDSHSIRYW
jgi:hypothetical protein